MYDFGSPEDYPTWLQEDIFDVIEDYKLNNNITPEEIETIAKSLYFEAQGLYDTLNRKEAEAEILMRIADDMRGGWNWIDKN